MIILDFSGYGSSRFMKYEQIISFAVFYRALSLECRLIVTFEVTIFCLSRSETLLTNSFLGGDSRIFIAEWLAFSAMCFARLSSIRQLIPLAS